MLLSMKRRNYTKSTSLTIIGLIYALAVATGVIVFRLLTRGGILPEILSLLAADVAATVIVWIFDLVFVNVSVYDPYWSVAPPVMFTALAVWKGVFTLPVILLLIAIWYWGIRLTFNWFRSFKGLGHEDWRYTKYRESLPAILFELTHFGGLVMMPTLIVFACMVPGFKLYDAPSSGGWLTWTGFAMCIAAATIQLVSDNQSYRFRQANPGQVCNVGLWKHGRHPNYFGEILIWWGVWVMYASVFGIDWLILSPTAMTALFLFISVPLMEHRQLKRKPGYAEYRKNTRVLI